MMHCAVGLQNGLKLAFSLSLSFSAQLVGQSINLSVLIAVDVCFSFVAQTVLALQPEQERTPHFLIAKQSEPAGEMGSSSYQLCVCIFYQIYIQ